MIRRVALFVRKRGLGGAARAAYARMRTLLGIRAKAFASWGEPLRGRKGIEIGGPSQVFTRDGLFPIYPIAAKVDNCNFADVTVWQGEILEGESFRYDPDRPPGFQFVAEATALGPVATASYDFVLSSHVLEHVADPLLALAEWRRVLKDEGTLVMLLPHKDHTFDHRRPVTSLDHLIADHANGVGEDDLTHLSEILELHDLRRDPDAGDRASFVERSQRNFENRCLHHHVFDAALAARLVEHAGFQVRAVEVLPPMHILVVALKSAA